MCGITGYTGPNNGVDIVAESLKNLEYRGYDSAGVALNDGSLEIHKREGQIDNLHIPSKSVDEAIGHTRWSTHGEPNDRNAHPHTDCTDSIAVVHNGIIDNYAELKAELLASHTFESETDTEVIPHLLEEELHSETSLVEAVSRVVDRLSGSYAIAVTHTETEGIVAARNDSPLVIGYGENEHFVASDVPAFIEYTNEVTYLEDGDIAHVTADDVAIYNDGQRISRDVEEISWDAEAAEKGGYEHYMLKEIHEQPTALRQCLSGRLDGQNGSIDVDVGLRDEYLQSLEEIQIIAAGTSYHAGLYAKQLFNDLAGVRVTPVIASEYDFDAGRDPWRTLVIAVTQSGETADTLEAIRAANAAGTRTLAVTNTVGSTVTRAANDTVYIRAGPEIGVAATKTFVSQIATLGMLAVNIGRRRNTLSSEREAEIQENIRSLPGAVQQVLDKEAKIERIADKYVDARNYFFIGREYGHAVSLEGALKLKEIAYDHAEGFPAGELKHGPLALIDRDSVVVAMLTDGTSPRETLNNVKEVQARGASVIGLTNTEIDAKFLDENISIPETGIFEPVVGNIALQLFAYYVANKQGRPIDKPRNLAKSVTVK